LFRKQLELLDRWGFTLITLADVHLFWDGELHLPRRPVILTFDGLGGFAPLAGVLREMGGRAMLFLSPQEACAEDVEQAVHHCRSLLGEGLEIGGLAAGAGDPALMSSCERITGLAQLRQTLEEMTGTRVHCLAYPPGSVNSALKRDVREAGFLYAMAGPAGPRVFCSDPLEIRRNGIGPDSGPLELAIRAFAPGDRVARLKTRSMSFFDRGYPLGQSA
jgi:peptidoglycan/xylan/chitin deacetylase (PgdA/CDA1 family)